jgi:hypothetical protein
MWQHYVFICCVFTSFSITAQTRISPRQHRPRSLSFLRKKPSDALNPELSTLTTATANEEEMPKGAAAKYDSHEYKKGKGKQKK